MAKEISYRNLIGNILSIVNNTLLCTLKYVISRVGDKFSHKNKTKQQQKP